MASGSDRAVDRDTPALRHSSVPSTPTPQRARRYFAWLLAASVLVFLAVMTFGLRDDAASDPDRSSAAFPPATMSPGPPNEKVDPHAPPESLPPQATSPRSDGPGNLATVIAVVSLLTSLVSMVGIAFTTALNWRKERRESALADVALEKAKLELAKLRGDASSGSAPGA